MLDIIVCAIFLILSCCITATEHTHTGMFFASLLSGLVGMGLCSSIYLYMIEDKPTVLDVYRGHTELVITYKSNGDSIVPTDTLVKFTEEYEKIRKSKK